MSDRSTTDDLRLTLLALIDPLAQLARLVLLLDERQPDALRTEAISMRPERLFWTLTQLDDGLPLEICQALVRATRLSRGRRPVGDRAEEVSAGLAAMAAADWLRARWPTVAAMTPLDWFGASITTPARLVAAGVDWLDAPPVVGPPVGAAPLPPPGLHHLAWLAVAISDGVSAMVWGRHPQRSARPVVRRPGPERGADDQESP